MNDKDKAVFKELIMEAAQEVATTISDKQIIKTTHATLAVMGLDVEDPRAMRQDFDHLRTRRLDREDTAKSAKDAVVRYSVTGMLAAIIAWLVANSPAGVN